MHLSDTEQKKKVFTVCLVLAPRVDSSVSPTGIRTEPLTLWIVCRLLCLSLLPCEREALLFSSEVVADRWPDRYVRLTMIYIHLSLILWSMIFRFKLVIFL